ncbi:MAG TPA: MOSC domain-containing protein, partial [Stellaceae bacterium]|nr:MOSC domain-containing protein [Stellaceae bacterium]
MTMTISALYRYPVKGLSAEPLQRVALLPGQCLPDDRRFAIALPSTQFDPDRPEWLSKTHFVMLMRDEQLAALNTR